MRIVFLGNNRVALEVLRRLKALGEDIAALVVHPAGRQKHGSEIIAASGLANAHIFTAPELRQPQTLQALVAFKPDLAISVFFGDILKPEFFELFPKGVINLHPAFLPYNRGAYPNVWSIVDQTPAGATLHYVNAGVDTGDIIAQRELPVSAADTGQTLYYKLEELCLNLFLETWPDFKTGRLARKPQPSGSGTCHRVSDINALDEIDLDKNYKARDLINLLRARTFPPYPGAYFKANGRKVYLNLQLSHEPSQEDKTGE